MQFQLWEIYYFIKLDEATGNNFMWKMNQLKDDINVNFISSKISGCLISSNMKIIEIKIF